MFMKFAVFSVYETASFSYSDSNITCENDQKVFYKIKKDCLRFEIEDESCYRKFRIQPWSSMVSMRFG